MRSSQLPIPLVGTSQSSGRLNHESFAKFVVDNYYFVDAPKDPCRGTFNKIFHQKDDELLKEFVRQFKEDGNEDQVESNTGK